MKYKEYNRLHAEWYEYRSAQEDHGQEIELWARCSAQAGGSALELGSGTGRVLVPLLARGLDVIGIDTSDDMMARCLSACAAKGLKAELHRQSMLAFDLHREFGLIFLDSGGLGLFVSDRDIQATFKRVMAHLKPGGLFIFEFAPVPAENKDRNDPAWTGNWVGGPDGVVIAWRQRLKYEAATRVWEILFVIEKFVDGHLVETEANERTGRYFTVAEAVAFAKAAGFVDPRATHWLTDAPPRDDSGVVTVQCRKPG